MREILGNERVLGDLAYLASMQLVLVRPKFLLGDFLMCRYMDRWSGTWPSRADVASPGNARMRRSLVINVFGEGNE